MNYFQLLKKLWDIYDSLEGKTVDHQVIVKRIRRAIPYRECKIFGNKTLSVALNTFSVSGLYDPDLDEDGLPPIEIEISFPKRKDTYVFDEDDLSRLHWSNLCVDFMNILGHEFVHLNQFRRRNFRWSRSYRSGHANPTIRESQNYYGNSDEVDAYAFNAAADMALNTLRPTHTKKPVIEKIQIYKIYTKLFEKNHPVVLKFEKRCNYYYKKLEQQYYATYRSRYS